MKDALRDLLVSYVGDDMVKVIVGPEGSGIDAFLFEELRDSLKKKYPKARMVDARGLSSEGIKKNCPKEGGGQRTFIFASNLWGYPDFDVIVNLCARKNGVDLFASALTPFPTAFPEKHTLIRGRVERFWFPSTLYEDYLKEHPSATAFAFLTSNDLNLEIVDQNLEALSRSETACLQAALEYGTNPLTVRSLAKSVSKNTKAEFSCYKASAALRKIESLGICYLIDRYDLKQKRVISGKVFFPVDNRYYKILGRGKTREELCMAPVLVGKLLYDRWDVKKAIYESQRDKRTYCRNCDARFLIWKNGWSFLLFLGKRPTDELVEKARLAPSSLPKIIVTFDSFGGVDYGDDGLIYYSFDTLLKEGLRIYGKEAGI